MSKFKNKEEVIETLLVENPMDICIDKIPSLDIYLYEAETSVGRILFEVNYSDTNNGSEQFESKNLINNIAMYE